MASDDGAADLGSSPGVPDPAPSADPSPPPPLEAPPKVADEPKAQAASSAPDWRDKYRKRGMADGREMLCTFIGERHQEALVALVDDLKLAKIDPWFDPTDFGGLFILAWDEILPPNFKITPRIAAAAMTTTVVGQRWWNHKKVVAAQKDDPDIQAWKRKQQEKEDADRAAKAKPAEAPQFAAPPQTAAPDPNINGMPRQETKETTEPKKPFDPELLI